MVFFRKLVLRSSVVEVTSCVYTKAILKQHSYQSLFTEVRTSPDNRGSTVRKNFKITFKSVLRHIRFVLMLVLHFTKSRDVTSLLKWVYSGWIFTRFQRTILLIVLISVVMSVCCFSGHWSVWWHWAISGNGQSWNDAGMLFHLCPM